MFGIHLWPDSCSEVPCTHFQLPDQHLCLDISWQLRFNIFLMQTTLPFLLQITLTLSSHCWGLCMVQLSSATSSLYLNVIFAAVSFSVSLIHSVAISHVSDPGDSLCVCSFPYLPTTNGTVPTISTHSTQLTLAMSSNSSFHLLCLFIWIQTCCFLINPPKAQVWI